MQTATLPVPAFVNRSEFARTLRTLAISAGGVTLSMAGEKPSTGYAVSVYGHEMRTQIMPSVDLIAAWVAEVGLENRPDLYVGVWQDGDHWFFDASTVVPDLETAVRIGRENRQAAVYDIDRGKSVYL